VIDSSWQIIAALSFWSGIEESTTHRWALESNFISGEQSDYLFSHFSFLDPVVNRLPSHFPFIPATHSAMFPHPFGYTKKYRPGYASVG
jgi:hypothetical protein